MGRRTGRPKGAPKGNQNRLIHGRYAGARLARRASVMALLRQSRSLLQDVLSGGTSLPHLDLCPVAPVACKQALMTPRKPSPPPKKAKARPAPAPKPSRQAQPKAKAPPKPAQSTALSPAQQREHKQASQYDRILQDADVPEADAKVDHETARKFFAGPCDFIWGASSVENLPPISLPEVAFVGRSNVGKSSLINALTTRKSLARVSNTPGRTREINFFRLNERLILADLPGYGYAKASRSLTAEWQTLIFAYLRGRSSLQRVALLIDSRRGIGELDEQVMKLLDTSAVSYLLVLTKLDQLKPDERAAVLADTTAKSHKHVAAYPEIVVTSSLKGEGMADLRSHLTALATP